MDDLAGISITLRPSGDRNILCFDVPEEFRSQFVLMLSEGYVDGDSIPINLALIVVPDWKTEEQPRGEFDPRIHVRIDAVATRWT